MFPVADNECRSELQPPESRPVDFAHPPARHGGTGVAPNSGVRCYCVYTGRGPSAAATSEAMDVQHFFDEQVHIRGGELPDAESNGVAYLEIPLNVLGGSP